MIIITDFFEASKWCSKCGLYSRIYVCRITFIYVALFTIQIFFCSKQLYSDSVLAHGFKHSDMKSKVFLWKFSIHFYWSCVFLLKLGQRFMRNCAADKSAW